LSAFFVIIAKTLIFAKVGQKWVSLVSSQNFFLNLSGSFQMNFFNGKMVQFHRLDVNFSKYLNYMLSYIF